MGWIIFGLAILCIALIAGNIFFITRLLSTNDSMENIMYHLIEFRDHIEIVQKTPLYMDDDIIKNLLNHSKDTCKLLNDIIKYYNFYEIDNDEYEPVDKKIILGDNKIVSIKEGERHATIEKENQNPANKKN